MSVPSGLFATAAAAVVSLLLAGCGATPVSPQGERRLPDERPGAYYQDDGPHANPPADLDRVPDAVPREEPLHRYANRPYRVLGQSFTPATRIAAFQQRGKASWYGRKFHGKRTASGEVYDMYKMTAAHPTLPIPSYVRVKNLDNDRSVVVRINDRGPFLRGRVIDLSYAAAHRLGYIEQGSTDVEVTAIMPGDELELSRAAPVRPLRRPGAAASAAEAAAVLPPEPPEIAPIATLPPVEPAALPSEPAAVSPAVVPPPPAAAVETARAGDGTPIATVRHYLQLGAFASRANAEDFRNMAAGEIDEPPERFEIVPQGLRFRLHLGPYATVEEARERAAAVAATLKIKPFVVAR